MARRAVDPITRAWKKAQPVEEIAAKGRPLELVDRQKALFGEWFLYLDAEDGKHYVEYRKF